jgi:glycosyltransferase involved in cell wall biosynthesis
MSSLVKKWDINLIHSQSAMPDLFVSPDRLAIPILTTIHTTIEGQVKATRSSGGSFFRLDSSERATLLLSPILTFLENRYYEGDRHFITVSEWAKKEFVKEKGIDAEKVAVIHNGVDAERFSSVTKGEAEPRFPELADISYPKVLYFSRLIDKKGINFLMKAIPNVLERCDAHFVFAGTGRAIQLDVPRENYTYLGYVEERKKPYLYALADIFILPSLYENLPISILEAMASGNAVIATSVGGIPELIKHRENGLLIQPKSDADIVEAVTTLVEDERLRERLVVNAKTTVATNFTTKSTVAKTLSYYAEVLARYGGRHRPTS